MNTDQSLNQSDGGAAAAKNSYTWIVILIVAAPLAILALCFCGAAGMFLLKSSRVPVEPPQSQQAPADDPPASQQLIIDVRTPGEFASGHIRDAINIPYDVIGSRIAEYATRKDQEIVLYCRSGRRSGVALETLNKMGYTRAVNAGGFAELRKKLGP